MKIWLWKVPNNRVIIFQYMYIRVRQKKKYGKKLKIFLSLLFKDI